ncbi:MAG: phosphoribosylaminoimidazolesuccinocarboxamide synthase [Phycisphaerae bacterium]|nr:phosphoribosylaminoimidazolesuccinocarboxamide synthase [Phycisphaerae bacterium]
MFRTSLSLPDRREGKVRDLYRVPAADGHGVGTGPSPRADRLLVVATDRVSAFDVVMPTPMPGKGCLLTSISLGWFRFLRKIAIIPDHLISADVNDVPGLSDAERALLDGRIMLCRSAKVVPIECVARGYLAGSGWAEYQRTGTICGITLPKGLKQCDRLPQPIFTPATKAEQGHDENISFDQCGELVGCGLMDRLRRITLETYEAAAEYAWERGVILADTKFEFGFALDSDGRPTEELLLIDEVLTPDSSRYWPREQYQPGRDQPSFDKQYLRNYLLELVATKKWDKNPPGPSIPDEIIAATMSRYEEARTRLAMGRGEK